jgi:hypothetical protein
LGTFNFLCNGKGHAKNYPLTSISLRIFGVLFAVVLVFEHISAIHRHWSFDGQWVGTNFNLQGELSKPRSEWVFSQSCFGFGQFQSQ